jgi:hypothetical protein
MIALQARIPTGPAHKRTNGRGGLRSRDHPSRAQGRGQVGATGPEPGRPCRSAQGGKPPRVDHLDGDNRIAARRSAGIARQDLDLDASRAFDPTDRDRYQHNVMISTPKTAKVGVPSRSTAALSPRLREHRKRQAAERLLMGAGWTDNDLVFWAIPMAPCCTLRGSPVASWRQLPGSDCRVFGCMISGTGGQRWRCRLASIRR